MGNPKDTLLRLTLLLVQVVLAGAFLIKLQSMNLVPPIYLLCVGIVIAVVNILLFALKNIKIAKTVMIVISIILSVLILVGIVVCSKVDNAVEQVVMEEKKEVTHVAVLVMDDNEITALEDLAGCPVGYFEEGMATDAVVQAIDAAVATPVTYEKQEDVMSLVDSLFLNQDEAIILNTAYIDMVAEVEGYEGFSEQVRIIYETEVETTVELAEVEATYADAEKDSFIVYISGIDKFGGIHVKSQSDVNILAAVNTKTGQIQLINTPRDYYVPLPISNGTKDKLTHAGLYGVDVSVGTLENLYGIDIDYYVRLNFSGFESIIDTLGGIDVYSEYDFTVEPIKHYTKGYNHLTGLEALAFARERKSFATGDNQRGKNQMAVIVALIDKISSKEMLMNFDQVMEEVSTCVQTNLTAENIYSLVRTQLANGTGWDIQTYSVTGSNSRNTCYSMPNTNTYVMLPNYDDIEEAKVLIDSVLNP